MTGFSPKIESRIKQRGTQYYGSEKNGIFFKELRKERGLTQEQLAEHFRVSRRTVSRWETGSNMPDLDILVEMADYYEVDLRELLDGERKSEKMDKELEETVLKVADYSNEEKQKVTRRMHFLFVGGLTASIVYMILLFTEHTDNFLGGFCPKKSADSADRNLSYHIGNSSEFPI